MRCQKCGSGDNLTKNSVSSKGTVQYICRECNTSKMRAYKKTLEGRRKVNEAIYRSTKKYAYKQGARMKVYYAVKNGSLCKPNKCEKCLKIKEIFAHHMDYAKPLEVLWLCRHCHVLIHK